MNEQEIDAGKVNPHLCKGGHERHEDDRSMGPVSVLQQMDR